MELPNSPTSNVQCVHWISLADTSWSQEQSPSKHLKGTVTVKGSDAQAWAHGRHISTYQSLQSG